MDWFDNLRFNIIANTHETVYSLDKISMTDLFKLNEYIDMKNFIENVSNAVQDDEMNRIQTQNKHKR